MANLVTFSKADAARYPLTYEGINLVIAASRKVIFAQIAFFGALEFILSWIVVESSGPAADIFQAIAGLILIGLFMVCVTFFIHLRAVGRLRKRIATEDLTNRDVDSFWWEHGDVLPVGWK